MTTPLTTDPQALRITHLTEAAQGGRLLNAREVATLLGRTATWFARNHSRLRECDFPPPVRGLGRRWDRAAIEAWLDRQLPADAQAPASASADPEMDAWAARLDARTNTRT